MKMTFIEYLVDQEFGDEEWAKRFCNDFTNVANKVHAGDCTNDSHPCGLCMYEQFLKEYKKYYFE